MGSPFRADYRKLTGRFMMKGFHAVGSGFFSNVLTKDGKRVVKVGSDNTWEPYVLWAAENGYAGTFAPKVHSFHLHKDGPQHLRIYTAVMERLDRTLARAYDCETRNVIHDGLYQLASNHCSRFDEAMVVSRMFPGIRKFIRDAYRAGFQGDWHTENWMVSGINPDGTYKRLVLIDPQSEHHDSKARRWRIVDNKVITSQGVTAAL